MPQGCRVFHPKGWKRAVKRFDYHSVIGEIAIHLDAKKKEWFKHVNSFWRLPKAGSSVCKSQTSVPPIPPCASRRTDASPSSTKRNPIYIIWYMCPWPWSKPQTERWSRPQSTRRAPRNVKLLQKKGLMTGKNNNKFGMSLRSDCYPYTNLSCFIYI